MTDKPPMAVPPALTPKESKKLWSSIDVKIEHEGRHIKLPSDPAAMSYDDAMDIIERVRDAENQDYDVLEIIEGAPWDALVALTTAMQEIYGVVIAQTVHTFFGDIRPQLVTVHTGIMDDDRIQVPTGQMKLPNVDAPVQVGIIPNGAFIKGTVKPKGRAALVAVANLARSNLRHKSIYKGSAIQLHVDDEGDLELTRQPDFLDLREVKKTDMIHTRSTMLQIEYNMFAVLEHTQSCRDNKIPLKRGILLEGKYGTGKTLTARVSAKVATDNGWTFIMLKRSQGLKAAIEFAKNYQPCLIFAEDIDRNADRDDEDVNDLINLLDGLHTKEMEMMLVLTTNHIEKIDKALLRPGRFDAIISILPPDAETAIRLIKVHARDLLDESVDLTEVSTIIEGWTPAAIREVVERAKMGMIQFNRTTLIDDDLLATADAMKRHIALLEEKEPEQTKEAIFYNAFLQMVGNGSNVESNGVLEELEGKVKSLESLVSRGLAIVQRAANAAKEAAENAGGSATRGAEIAERTLVAVQGATARRKSA